MASDTVAVIGGGPGGLRAAHGIAEVGAKVVLIEQRDFLGGTPIAENYAGLTPHGEEAEPQMRRMAELVTSHPLAEVRLGTKVTGFDGEPGAFTLTVDGPGGVESLDCGAVVVATGFQHFDPGRETQMYGYYEFPDVLALQDLEAMLKEHRVVRPSNGEPPERLCFIQCVGSRDRRIGNEYCSKVCCGVASKEAIEVRQLLPDCKVFIFYIDMRMYGYWESQIYWPAQEKHHVQYVKGIVTEVLPKGDKLVVRGEDTTMGRPMEIPMDMVVLSVGMEPSAGTRQIAGLLGVGQNKYGFIDAVGAPLDPVSTDREGIFACGAALGPADLEDTVSSASNAALRAVSFVRSRAAAAAS
ncbi:CoB--CoM heterodisulfide reductase iron-sulfur subunit A family protein [Amycolatopsis sp. K13G38]|uniref:CoB--CoM heterodisulfide reductase iron-sulfur subunit A family protein n=1 Tax=Amycolatopsis acididurans TaxID=2724524 RepID=A0ABX1J401_9PSEU|nr:FAD-dependent oxidoreductase [Amycolatopsis acididurans]NKQ54389.1 CoB--CoM heterodisulfide reductase iron-sulfur subunit A family protein [Amycolatopsis acididurans]